MTNNVIEKKPKVDNKVDETIAGTINNKENGFEIPPVKYNNKLNCAKS